MSVDFILNVEMRLHHIEVDYSRKGICDFLDFQLVADNHLAILVYFIVLLVDVRFEGLDVSSKFLDLFFNVLLMVEVVDKELFIQFLDLHLNHLDLMLQLLSLLSEVLVKRLHHCLYQYFDRLMVNLVLTLNVFLGSY